MSRGNSYIEKVDRFVGSKIHDLRLIRGFSRLELAKLIEVSHQQLQKYESGTNRIAVGRLLLTAKALNERAAFFYEGLEKGEPVITKHQRMCIEVSRNFMKITNPEHQAVVSKLIRSLVEISEK